MWGEEVFAWYASLVGIERLFALIAVGATLILFLQTALQLIGLGSSAIGSDTAYDSTEGGEGDFSIEANDSDVALDIDVEAEAELIGELGDSYEGEAEFDHAEESDSAERVAYMNQSSSAAPVLRLFTMRTLVAFFSLAGWAGLIALGRNWDLFTVFSFAILIGAAGSYIVAKMMQILLRLTDMGNIDPYNAIGQKAEVYIRIPASKGGVGKVNLILQERYLEMEAITGEARDLTPGTQVLVVALGEEDVLVVTRI